MTLDEIAKLAGVSKTTASYVINGKAKQYRISNKTQEKVNAVVKEHNFKPNMAASSLRAGSSRSLGLIIPDLENNSYARLAKLIEKKARDAGYQILIGCSDDCPETEREVAEALVSRKVDALMVASCMADNDGYYVELKKSGTLVIGLDRPMNTEHFSCVISEDFQAALDLTCSVFAAEIRSVGMIGAIQDLPISKHREEGFRSACHEKGKQLKIDYGQNFSREEGKKVFESWVRSGLLPDALITTSFTLLEGVLDVMLEKPELMNKIRLATFGDNRLLDFLPFQVNSLPQQFELIAQSAIDLALSGAKGKNQLGSTLIPRKLIQRSID